MNYQGLDASRANGIPVPGKNTLVGQEKSKGTANASDIGNAYIEGRGFCQERPDAKGCELKPDQFRLLVDAYQKRVTAAQLAFGDALGELRIDTILKPDEDAAPLLGMLVDVMASVALGGIGSAIASIKSTPAASTFGLGLDVQEVEDVLSVSNVLDGGKEAINWIVKASVDHGKKALKSTPPSTEKNVTLDYIQSLQNASAIAWEHQREDPPGYATHADLIVLFHAFSASNGFTTPMIKQALSSKIQRYLASSTARIGRHQMRTEQDIKIQGNTVRDTKVAWVPDRSGVPVLYYLKQDAKNSQSPHTLSDHDVPMLELIDRDFVRDRPVEPEFVEVAISRHKDIWGKDPETLSPDTGINANDPRTWITRAR